MSWDLRTRWGHQDVWDSRSLELQVRPGFGLTLAEIASRAKLSTNAVVNACLLALAGQQAEGCHNLVGQKLAPGAPHLAVQPAIFGVDRLSQPQHYQVPSCPADAGWIPFGSQ